MIKVNSLKGYENVLDIYFVDEKGYIFSEQIGRMLKPRDNGRGYMQVKLKLKGARRWKHAYVHILVATAFIPNPMGFPEVNHIDENKSNNRADNLEWTNHAENNRYGTKNQRMVRTRCDDIYVYDWQLKFVGVFIGVAEATRRTLGRVESRARNRRVKNFFYLDKPIENFGRDQFLEITNNSDYFTVVVQNISTGEKIYFPTNRETRRFFDNKVNITDAINKKWLVRKTYRIYNLDYAELIDSPNLREPKPQEAGDKEPL